MNAYKIERHFDVNNNKTGQERRANYFWKKTVVFLQKLYKHVRKLIVRSATFVRIEISIIRPTSIAVNLDANASDYCVQPVEFRTFLEPDCCLPTDMSGVHE